MTAPRPSSLLLVAVDPELSSQILSRICSETLQGHSTSNSEQALEAMDSVHPELVVVDPTSLGGQARVFLRTLQRSHTPFIVYASNTRSSDVTDYLNLGAVRYFPASESVDDIVVNIRLTMRYLEDMRGDRGRQPSGSRLLSASRTEKLVGICMSEWGLPADKAKAVINRFARNRNVSIDEIARQKLAHNQEVVRIIEQAHAQIAAAKPSLIADLERFWIDLSTK